MKTSRLETDRLFLLLLLLETAMVGIYFSACGPGTLGDAGLLAGRAGGGFPSWVSALQLALIGVLFLLSVRRRERATVKPSGGFLRLIGSCFLLLSLERAGDFFFPPAVVAERTLAHPFDWLPPALFIAVLVLRAGRRSLLAMWSHFHRESVIMLAGVWLLLLGAVGLDALQRWFLRDAALLELAMKAFLEMSGGTVILYGVLLFRQRQEDEQGDVELAIA